ncbi:hypothetical protein GGI12_001855 [Dipsacomyces acuminosporus]|nr:hypothetical protein GGI12_001855 [Dipsacomyces acuminosporus]
MSTDKGAAKTSRCLLDVPDNRSDDSDTGSITLNPNSKGAFTDPSPSSDSSAGKKTFRVEPPSALLSRLQAFLPQIAEANKKLEVESAADPDKLNIENVDENEGRYIEMDLGLGVFDMKPKSSRKNPGDNIHIGTSATLNNGSSDSSDSDEGPASSVFGSKVIIDPSSVLHGTKGKPHIEVLDNSTPETNSGDSD